MWLIGILAGTLVAMFTLAGGGWVPLDDSIPVLSTLVGLIGGAIGFYFGNARHHSQVIGFAERPEVSTES